VLPGPTQAVWIHTKVSRLGAVSATDLHAFELEWTSLRVSCDSSPPSYRLWPLLPLAEWVPRPSPFCWLTAHESSWMDRWLVLQRKEYDSHRATIGTAEGPPICRLSCNLALVLWAQNWWVRKDLRLLFLFRGTINPSLTLLSITILQLIMLPPVL
jgi:hypothetical protein